MPQSQVTGPADLVLTGGPVHTVDPARSRATAVAVRGGRIIAVGHDEVHALVGPGTEVVDLAGRLLLPGFQDAHVHPQGAGLELGACHLADTSDPAEYLRRIRAYADARPDAAWITGGGWSLESFPGGAPTAAALDAVVPDRPVFLPNRDHHGAWVNTRALERAGIDARTPDPADGRIERDADGNPTGMLQEGAVRLVGRLVPAPTSEERLTALLRAQAVLHSHGVTAWQDALVGAYADMPDPAPSYRTAVDRGLLTARVVGALWWDRERGAEQIPELVARREELSGGRFRAGSVKIMQDGIAENHTAAMLDPYLKGCGCASGGSGISFVEPGELRKYVTELDALGFQTHFHALGDRAVREALDAVEAARTANGRRDTRHHLAHLQVVHPDDVPRFRALGATANLQMLWAAHEPQMDELTLPFLGPERGARQYPFGDLLRAGATLAAGSDWPVSSPDPLQAVHVAVNRRSPDAPEGTPEFLPGQRLDLGAALAAYTAGSSYANHLDALTGSITVGKAADLVVLDRDPFAGPPEDIAATRVLQTFVDGERVHAAPDA
ncbi:amidohydrolase [Streptomyces scabiei]|uniref:amidohydrolase n=2 Tax=Streptomyces scabiei TaxID=1930 RepID=UPI000765CC48|nr:MULTISPECIES: amidohydrolase [Streptomyces]MBP5871730.1 amidohydrolase [Streptomyces sp. LBUM 1485]MBP5880208.1 amidohydrolase [Streptomyces sp. LBUM 1477]MBP5888046.1 amidohydrolase [Streptomyces sp. LBUM 1487]MBP5912260.1 amidohydrolase [Streptomyces sp. LBUM 1486]MDW8477717.1 amidohydrolase [Streptomyces scabiei]